MLNLGNFDPNAANAIKGFSGAPDNPQECCGKQSRDSR